jgi:hypothetical protein
MLPERSSSSQTWGTTALNSTCPSMHSGGFAVASLGSVFTGSSTMSSQRPLGVHSPLPQSLR